MKKQTKSSKKQQPAKRNPWLEQRVIVFVGQKLNIDLSMLFHIGQSKKNVRWILDGKEISRDPGLELQFDKPGRHRLTIEYDNRQVSRIIDVGVRFGDLLEDPASHRFIYLLVGKNRGKVMFFPIGPATRVTNLVNHRKAVLDQMAQGEAAYMDFANRQSQVWSNSILRKPVLPLQNIHDGVYALFENGLVHLGLPRNLRDKLEAVKIALNHDAEVSDPALAEPAAVFSGITELVQTFDPRQLVVDPNAIVIPGSAANLEAVADWIQKNINSIFSHFIDHLGTLGVNGLTSRVGSMFTYNTLNFTFSSRFSDMGLGLSRHSTNMLGFGGTEGYSISLTGMLGDGERCRFSNQGGRIGLMEGEGANTSSGAYWDDDHGVLILGASSPQEAENRLSTGGDILLGVNADGDVVGLIVGGDPSGSGGEEGGGEEGGREEGGGEEGGGEEGGGEEGGGEEGGGEEGGGEEGGGEEGGGEEGGGEGSGPTGGGEVADSGGGENGDTGVSTPLLDGATGGSGTTPLNKLSLDEAMKAVRGGGHTDPNPEYDGNGGGDFAFFLGRVGPLEEDPYDTLINPGDIDGPMPDADGGVIPVEIPVDPAIDPVPDFLMNAYTVTSMDGLANARGFRRCLLFTGQVVGHNMRGLFGFAGSIIGHNVPTKRSGAESRLDQVLKRLDRIESLLKQPIRSRR
jgi:hypothetical protein